MRGEHLAALAFVAVAAAQQAWNPFAGRADAGPASLQVGPVTLEGGPSTLEAGVRDGYAYAHGNVGNVQVAAEIPANFFCPQTYIDCFTCPEPGLLPAVDEVIPCLASAGEDGRRQLQSSMGSFYGPIEGEAASPKRRCVCSTTPTTTEMTAFDGSDKYDCQPDHMNMGVCMATGLQAYYGQQKPDFCPGILWGSYGLFDLFTNYWNWMSYTWCEWAYKLASHKVGPPPPDDEGGEYAYTYGEPAPVVR